MDEKLIQAAELIENNFAQGDYLTPTFNNQEYCIDGAILRAYGYVEEIATPDEFIIEFGRTYLQANAAEAQGDPKYMKSVVKVVKVLPQFGDCCHARQPNTRIHHYNDVHCQGGIEAAKILREAAEIE